MISALSATPAAAWGSAFNVASISVRYGSGVVQQTITLSDSVAGTGGDLVITTNSNSSGLVTGLNVSSSTHGACAKISNGGTEVDWVCGSNDWGAGTLAVLIDTGSPGSVPPGTGNDPDAVTTTISEESSRSRSSEQATGTVSLLAPAAPAPTTHPPTRPAPKPSGTNASGGSVPSIPTGTPSATAAPISPSPTSTVSALSSPSGGGAVAVPTGSASPPESFYAASTGSGSSPASALIVIGAILLAIGLALIHPFRSRRRPAETPWEER